jgi:hypothetical protein
MNLSLIHSQGAIILRAPTSEMISLVLQRVLQMDGTLHAPGSMVFRLPRCSGLILGSPRGKTMIDSSPLGWVGPVSVEGRTDINSWQSYQIHVQPVQICKNR